MYFIYIPRIPRRMGNKFPRVTVKLQEHHPGHFRITLPPWVIDHLGAEKGSVLKPSIWRKGDNVDLQEDAVILEVVRVRERYDG